MERIHIVKKSVTKLDVDCVVMLPMKDCGQAVEYAELFSKKPDIMN